MSEPADGDGSKSKPGEGDKPTEATEATTATTAKAEEKAEATEAKPEATTAKAAKAEATTTATEEEEKQEEAKEPKAGKAAKAAAKDAAADDLPKATVVKAADPDPFQGAMTYPDDGTLAYELRRIDSYLGTVEQIVLVALLAAVTLTAATHAILERAAHIQLAFKDDVIRGGTFAIAMLGGVFATHQARHLSMDLISRKFSRRNRLYLKVALSFFMFFIVALMIRAGFHTIRIEEGLATRDKLISSVRIAWLIPIGGFLIILHTFIHTIIDIDYIVRGKVPPERMRSGH